MQSSVIVRGDRWVASPFSYHWRESIRALRSADAGVRATHPLLVCGGLGSGRAAFAEERAGAARRARWRHREDPGMSWGGFSGVTGARRYRKRVSAATLERENAVPPPRFINPRFNTILFELVRSFFFVRVYVCTCRLQPVRRRVRGGTRRRSHSPHDIMTSTSELSPRAEKG